MALGREVLGTSQVGIKYPENVVGLEVSSQKGLLRCMKSAYLHERGQEKKYVDALFFFPSLNKDLSSGDAISINRTTWVDIL